MKTNMRIPPRSKADAMSGQQLAETLNVLIGKSFPLTDKPRTNGSTLRKMIESVLKENPAVVAEAADYKVTPYKKKGVPRLLNQLADSYIVTSGDSYNLQVWNRFPNSRNVLIRYATGKKILCSDIRLVLVKVDTELKVIQSIIVATPHYIEKHFGKFGVPTMKYQLIISSAVRQSIVGREESILFHPDTEIVSGMTASHVDLSKASIASAAAAGSLLSLGAIKERVATNLIGMKLPIKDTKSRGQLLEREVVRLLGYIEEESLVGNYPDLPHQLLEVKVQDSPTVDLGKYSPSHVVVVNDDLQVTTLDIRYLIALTNPSSGVIEGLVLMPGGYLGDHFTFVNGTNFKCQRSIPISFFDHYEGQAVFNP